MVTICRYLCVLRLDPLYLTECYDPSMQDSSNPSQRNLEILVYLPSLLLCQQSDTTSSSHNSGEGSGIFSGECCQSHRQLCKSLLFLGKKRDREGGINSLFCFQDSLCTTCAIHIHCNTVKVKRGSKREC